MKISTVDAKTGKVMSERTVKPILLPAKAGTCPDCAVKHEAHLPHNRDSLFYQYSFYYANNSRWPTWEDAMAHCDEAMKELWRAELKKRGVA